MPWGRCSSPGLVDALRRAFLWVGGKTVSDAQCLVSWDKSCLSKKDGGLGVRDLQLQNTCMLLKLVHRAHDAKSSAWSRWLDIAFSGLLEAPGSTGAGVHLASLRRLLPDYRLLTTVEVGDGRTTAFWHDCWTAVGPLAEAYPALFTHVRRSEATVHNVMSSSLRHAFVPLFSAAAAEEYVTLSSLVADVALTDDVDV
jgi:hypothetical protein